MRIASMPMYDMPEVREALDTLWTGLAHNMKREGVPDVPGAIVHGQTLHDLWSDPRLLLSQCCGYDIVHGFAGKLRPIATPRYGAPGCRGSDYASMIVVADDCDKADILDMRGSVCVINGWESHSGMSALRALVAPSSRNGRFFSDVKVSGTHAASLEMVRLHEADVTAIDCVTYALLESYRPDVLDGTHVLGRTYRAPGIPYVTRWNEDKDTVARIRTSVLQVFADSDFTTARRALYLKDVELPPHAVYRRIVEAEEIATRHGYPELR